MESKEGKFLDPKKIEDYLADSRKKVEAMKNVEYKLQKTVFGLEDLDNISFHDSYIYGMCKRVSNGIDFLNLYFDIDLMLEWVEEAGHYYFWVAPATLEFKTATDMKINIKEEENLIGHFQITDFSKIVEQIRGTGYSEYKWILELTCGKIEFLSSDFKCYLRNKPVFTNLQAYPMELRGNPSFDTEFNGK